MTLILNKPAGSTIDLETLKIIKKREDRKFGMMFPDDGSVKFFKGKDVPLESIMALVSKSKDKNVTFFFDTAWASSDSTAVNCQPFPVLTKEEHGKDLYLMQTGYLTMKPKNQMDDAFNLIEKYLRPFLSKDPWAIYDESFIKILKMWSSAAVFYFVDGDGTEVVINREKGKVSNKCWYSNEYSHTEYQYQSQHNLPMGCGYEGMAYD